MLNPNPMAQTDRKKTDYGALHSPFMRVPRMSVRAARALLDAGVRDLFELPGRSAESLLDDLRAARPGGAEPDLLPYFRLAIYYAEKGTDAEAAKLHPTAWQ